MIIKLKVSYAIFVGGYSENCLSALEEVQKKPAGFF